MLKNVHNRKPDEAVNDPTINLSMTNSVMCSMTATCHNITYAIAVLSRCKHDLCNEFMAAIKRMVRFLNATKN
jgi:hypothetical protein